ncbi:class I SAM-dependent methyltransferase [Nitrincola sp.]|uniref:class I SAM-dependent methyltransferase n=1 Tax=Nitrincola sp. TaxID=1926584 RepID=UPI003A91A38E
MDVMQDRWREYYAQALRRRHSARTEQAVELNSSGFKSAIDCGCGSGSDIDYLSQQGYRVQGFDNNPEAIEICCERFGGNVMVDIACCSFEDYDYPDCGLVLAHSSLFFSDAERFSETWNKMISALQPGGVFSGDFMGIKDDWALNPQRQINAMTEQQVRGLFEPFDLVHFNERDEPGKTALGYPKHWHIFSVLAVKKEKGSVPFYSE